MNRYNLALLFLAIAAIPLFYVSAWLGLPALMAIYALLTRLANEDFDRHGGSCEVERSCERQLAL